MKITEYLLVLALVLTIGFLIYDRKESESMAGASKAVVVTLWGQSTCSQGTHVSSGIAFYPSVGGTPICVANIEPVVGTVPGFPTVLWATGQSILVGGNFTSEGFNGRIDCAVCIIKPEK